MSISWGPWEYSGGNGMRVGIESSWSAVATGSTAAVLTVKIYTENQYYYTSDTQVLTYSGGLSGTTSYVNNEGSSAITLRATKTYTYTYSTYGSSPGSVTVGATVSGAYNGVTPSESVAYAIPARPYAAPNAPSSVTAVRNSDTQATVGWTRNVTSQKPYTSCSVARRVNTNGVWGAYVVIATTSATATSFVDTRISANHEYQYVVRANNTIGSSSFIAAAAGVPTTPSPPSAVTAAISGGGSTITMTATTINPDYSGSFPVTYDIQRSVAGGGYSNVATGLAYASPLVWTDPSPGAGTNQYQVRAIANSLTSAYTASNVVSTVVAPLAPTLLSPNGGVADLANVGAALTWHHNQGGDGAAQSHFQVQFSSNGGSTWVAFDTGSVTSTTNGYTLAAGVLANGVTYQWRVRTEGIVAGGYGPYSAAATIVASSTPASPLVAGQPGASTTTLPMLVGWTYSQAEGSAQSAWQMQILDATATIVLFERDGLDASGSTSVAGTDFVFVDGTTYTVQVRTQSGAGLWSAWGSTTTTFSLLPPAAVDLTADYQPCTGTMVLHLVPEVDVPGTTLPVVSAKIERSIDGSDWVTIADDVTMPADVLDMTPRTSGENIYRITSVSAAPSYYVNPSVMVDGTDGDGQQMWGFLSYGDSFENVLRMRGALTTGATSDRVRKSAAMLGRRLPLALFGVNVSRTVDVKGTIRYDERCPTADDCTYDSPRDDWEGAAWDSEIVCWRDWTGRRLFGILSQVSTPDGPIPGMASVSFQVEQVGYTERVGTV